MWISRKYLAPPCCYFCYYCCYCYLYCCCCFFCFCCNTGLPRLASVNQQKISCASLLKIQIWIPHKYFASCLALTAKMMHWKFGCNGRWIFSDADDCDDAGDAAANDAKGFFTEDFRGSLKELTGVWGKLVTFVVIAMITGQWSWLWSCWRWVHDEFYDGIDA